MAFAEGAFEGTFQDWSRRVVPEDAERVTAGIEACLAHQQAEYAYEFRAVMPDGRHRWLRTQAQFFYGPSGVPERMVGVNIDIDAQKQAESDLRQQWHTFDTALSHTPDFTYTFDLEGRFTYVNRALLSLWQKPLKEAVGKNFFELGYPPELAARLQRSDSAGHRYKGADTRSNARSPDPPERRATTSTSSCRSWRRAAASRQ